MKHTKYTFLFLPLLLALASCSNSEKNEGQSSESSQDSCKQMVVDSTVAVTWTAFKTTERIGVSGTFDVVQINGLQKANSVSEILGNATFEIPVSSVNSMNPDRDKKIFVHFFSNMMNSGLLAGQVLAISNDKCQVGLVMNNVRDTMDFDLKVVENRVVLSGAIDVAKWNALSSIEALNEVCYDLHKGADGVSKLWPDVKLEISASLAPYCE